jgi:hypothetical protein
MTLRLLAVIACIVAIILFILGAVDSAGVNLKDYGFGLVAVSAALGFLALDGYAWPGRAR